METLDVIKKRTSLKTHFSNRPLEPDKIEQILSAARLAPSGRNRQPWRFIVVKDRDAIEKLVNQAFPEGNQLIKEASVIIIACADPRDDATTGGKEYYLFAVGLAVENMLLAATDLGLVTHLISGANEDELKKILKVPQEVRFIVAIPVAYPAEGSYDEAAKERLSQRTRKDLAEFVYDGTWGKPF